MEPSCRGILGLLSAGQGDYGAAGKNIKPPFPSRSHTQIHIHAALAHLLLLNFLLGLRSVALKPFKQISSLRPGDLL